MFGFFKKKKQPCNELTHRVAGSTSSLVRLQLMGCLSSTKIGDDWTVGYIGGFAEQISVEKGIADDARRISVILLVFGSVFGDKERLAYLNRYESLIQTQNAMAIEGDNIARNEALALLNGSAQRAMGLSSYCLDMLDQYVEVRAPKGGDS